MVFKVTFTEDQVMEMCYRLFFSYDWNRNQMELFLDGMVTNGLCDVDIDQVLKEVFD